MDEVLTRELALFRKKTGKKALRILEIGTIRATGNEYQDGDGWSTLTFANDVKAHGGEVIGVDLEIDAARTILDREGVGDYVHLIKGYSVNEMGRFIASGEKFDVIFLDSDNEPTLVMDEWFLAKHLLAEPGLIMADDMDQGVRDVLKGAKLIPHLKGQGIDFRIEQRVSSRFTRDILVVQP